MSRKGRKRVYIATCEKHGLFAEPDLSKFPKLRLPKITKRVTLE